MQFTVTADGLLVSEPHESNTNAYPWYGRPGGEYIGTVTAKTMNDALPAAQALYDTYHAKSTERARLIRFIRDGDLPMAPRELELIEWSPA